MSYNFLLDLAVILLSTKALGMLTRRIHMPQVVGALLAGLLLGPAGINFLKETEFLAQLSELGVIVILFTAGVGTDIKELKSTGKSGMLIAIMGVLFPVGMGALLTVLAGKFGLLDGVSVLEGVFIGTVLAATSVSITVETLKELGKLNTRVGSVILASALIDDVLGLVVLSAVSGLSGQGENVVWVLVKIVLFFVFAGVFGLFAEKIFELIIAKTHTPATRRYTVFAFVICLFMAYAAERFFGVADIIGAYAAGLVVSCTSKAKMIESKFEPLSYLLLTPVFFASVGIKVVVSDLNTAVVIFSLLLLAVAILSKVIGCGIGAAACHFKPSECLQVGVGMACRGEVALIVASRGVATGVLGSGLMTPIVIMVVGCAILTPVMLKLTFKEESGLHESKLVERYEEIEQLDIIQDRLLEQDRALRQKKKP